MTILALMFAAATVAAAPQLDVLSTELPVWDVAAADIDGNGKGDILALCSDPEKTPLRKQLAVYLAGDSGYSSRPSFTLPLGRETGGVFLSDTNGQPPAELVVTDPGGAQVYTFADGAFRPDRRVEFRSLLPTYVKKPVFLKDTASDLNGDSKDEWLLPTPVGYDIRSADAQLAQVEADVDNAMDVGESSRILHRLPLHKPFEFAPQSLKGVAFLSAQYIDYAYGDNWSRHARYRIPNNSQEKWATDTRMEDIDGNGLPDLVVAQTHGTVNLKVLTQVYLAKEPFTFSDTPDATFNVSGALTSPLVRDVDGDGRSDLLFIKVPFGVKMFVSYFVSQKLTVQIEAHLSKEGGFNGEPDLRASLTVDAPENRKRVAYTMGDFNGDKRIDVAFGSGEGQLVVHSGEADRLISSRPTQTLDVPSIGEARPYKLNEGDAEDIVLFHPSTPHEKRIDVIVF
jgi:hypothetical protein